MTIGSGKGFVLLLERGRHLDAWKVKFALAPRITRGYHEALSDLGLEFGKVVYSGEERYPLSADAIAAGLGTAILDVAA